MSEGADGSRRHFLHAGLLIAGAGAGVGAAGVVPTAPAPVCRPGRSVRDYGARGDGFTDDTAAFNRATRAADSWDDSLAMLVHVPAGRYRLDGIVHVRKGQHLQGDGEPTLIDARRARDHTFVLGSGLQGGTTRPDPGGAPVQISDLRTVGGAPAKPLLFTDAQGFALRRLFLSAPGTAIHITGADGIVSDVVIDQALNGLIFERCQNVVVSRLITYLVNYAVTLGSGARDLTLTDAQLCYSRYAALLLAEDATGITNVRVSSCGFVMNEQFATFAGYVHSRATGADVAFNDCSFRNWPGHAVDQAAGRGTRLSFARCVFDGLPTHPEYNGSVSGRVVSTGAAGQLRFVECEFRHLRGEIALIKDELGALDLIGGRVADCSHPRIRVMTGSDVPITVRDVAGLVLPQGRAAMLPAWPGARWNVSLRPAGGPPGDAWRGTVVAAASPVVVPSFGAAGLPSNVAVRVRRVGDELALELSRGQIAAIEVRSGV